MQRTATALCNDRAWPTRAPAGGNGGSEGQGPTAAERRGNPERVKAFTDGVFAIIITILVLEIDVPPDLGEQSLRNALGDTAPTLLAWVISFLITGMYWVWHRDLFAQIRTVNRDIVWLNLARIILYGYVVRRPSLLWEPPSDRSRRIGMYIAAAPLLVYVVAMVVASVSTTVSLLLYLALPLLYFGLITVLRSSPDTCEEAEDLG